MATRNVDDEEEGQRDRFVVLLRHGIAEEKSEGKTDADRSLTSEGHARMKQIAKGLERAFPKAQAIYSSPLLRATQTALWVSKGYRLRIKVNKIDVRSIGPAEVETARFIRCRSRRRIALGAIDSGHQRYIWREIELCAEDVAQRPAIAIERRQRVETEDLFDRGEDVGGVGEAVDDTAAAVR